MKYDVCHTYPTDFGRLCMIASYIYTSYRVFPMTKTILLIFYGILITNICLGQKIFNTEKKDDTNIYRNALTIYCNSLDKNETKIVYVEPNYLLTGNLPKTIDSIEIKYPDLNQLKKLIKANGGHIMLIRIIPLKINQSDFFVNIIPFYTTYKKNNFNLANGGGLTVHYKFDFNLGGLIYQKHDFIGI